MQSFLAAAWTSHPHPRHALPSPRWQALAAGTLSVQAYTAASSSSALAAQIASAAASCSNGASSTSSSCGQAAAPSLIWVAPLVICLVFGLVVAAVATVWFIRRRNRLASGHQNDSDDKERGIDYADEKKPDHEGAETAPGSEAYLLPDSRPTTAPAASTATVQAIQVAPVPVPPDAAVHVASEY